ncbi:FxsA family protein [Halioxenophilus sp. WMMB6]|uniref:FxsA family protein n=1 Tax=Halioxenophilus sp. WMMB6 TaxID=3073815 RepID=UPI00295F3A5F|nr:FxsA family protein [Halioxenophilus sp. WMMB6]
MRLLFILFIYLVLEFWLMVAVGTHIGALAVVLITLATAAIGLSLVQRQGLATLAQAQEKMNKGESPAGEMVSGLALFLGGLLLLIPGFISDGVGILLMIPGLRMWLARRMLGPITRSSFTRFRFHGSQYQNGRTFEGEFEETGADHPRSDKKNQNFLP